MGTKSVTELTKLHLFNLPPPMLVSVIESLLFKEIVGFVDFTMLSNKKGRSIWHAQVKRMIRCPDMDNRMYSTDDEGSLRWVLKREIPIKNFTTRELENGMTELHWACCDDEIWLVRACITFNDADDINKPHEHGGQTPLNFACDYAHIDVVKLLLESGAQKSLYHKDFFGKIPIEHTICSDKIDMTKLLLKYHEKDKKKALDNLGETFGIAAQSQNLELVQLILEVTGPDIIHYRNSSSGSTALHRSCIRSDDTEVMEFLLASGAKVNAVDTDGETPLFWSISYLRLECAKVLLAAGATVNHRRNDGDTPLDIALRRSGSAASAKMIEVLEAAGGLRAADLPDDDSDDEDA